MIVAAGCSSQTESLAPTATPSAVVSASPQATAAASAAPTIAPTAVVTVAASATPAASSTPQPSAAAAPIAATAKPSPIPTPAPASAAPPASAKPQTADDGATSTAAQAQVLYKDNCMACHGEGLTGDFGPNLTKVGSRKTKDEIAAQIINGKGDMPPFQSTLKSAEIEALAAWLAAKK
nr:cytochrome c [Paenibacillus alba]